MRKLTLALSVAALAITGPAFAQASAAPAAANDHQHARGHMPITRADAEARADRLFARLDLNRDGRIDATDRAERRDQRRDKRFAKLDADHNGAISRDEFAAAGDKARERFAQRAEGAEAKDGRRFGGHRMALGGRHGMHGHNGLRGLAMAGKKADTDRDGAISKSEFETRALAMFDRADADHDGTVTPEERKQMHSGHRGRHHREPAAAAG
jgi:Ca2+-binding EF-hand superfamily protein